MMGSVFVAQWAAERSKRNIVIYLMALSGVAALFLIIASLDMLQGWSDPFENADTSDVNGRRGGLAVLVIRFWPFALGGYSIIILWNAVRGFVSWR